MRTKSYLILSLVMCLSLVGCTDDNSAAGPSNNGSNNGSDAALADASDVASDTGGEDATEDTTAGECTVDSDCNGQPNQVGFCETSTGTCTYTCDDGYADCDADPSNGCEIDLNADADNCGTCDNTCDPTLNQQAICSAGTCDVDPDQCTDGFVDLNGQASDGCECEITDENDVPDADGVDSNCDGVDGIVDGANANIVFVSPDGDDTADGLSAATAVETLTVAIGIADDEDRPYVLAAGGTFVEQVELVGGVSIYGGYDAADNWARDTDDQTTTIAPTTAEFDAAEMHYKTVVAEDIDEPTTLDALTIEGVDASSGSNAGASTYALWANNADALTVDRSVILAGEAARGADGIDATGGADRLASGACTPANGGAGATADSTEKPCGNPNINGDNANSGLSGELADISNNLGVGGAGGIHHCDADDGTDGESGSVGTPGDDGNNGQTLADGTGSLDVDGHWTLGTGTAPTDGQKGGGGGGGGAGGNYETTGLCTIGNTCNAVGGNGGDGGDGGCAATGSTNGEAGGGSFGVAIIAGTITLTDTTITLGTAGTGGAGGDGAAGANGDFGEAGGPDSAAAGGLSGRGGRGGNGGNGGDAGAGAGGCGGASFGIMTAEGVTFTPDATVTIDDSNISPAAGGAGGEAVDGSNAPDGCEGEVAETYGYTAP